MIILKTSATISDDFANVIKSGKYEEIIYELMCRSEVVFPGKYQYNQEQLEIKSQVYLLNNIVNY